MNERARIKAALLLGTGLMLAGFLLPTFSYAVGTAADAQCAGSAQCPVGMGPGQGGPCSGPGGGTIGKACMDSTNGFTTPGTCISTIPPKCQATSAPGLNGGNSLSSLSSLAGQLGQLLGQLLKGSGSGSGSGSSAPATTATTCTTYTPTSDPTQIGVNPCVYYDPSAASALTTGSVTGTTSSAQDLLNALNGSTGTASTGSDTLSATPATGPTPLSVTFTTSPIDSTQTYSVDPGDGGSNQALSSNGCSSTSSATCVYGGSYTYNTAGTYTATLLDANGDSLASATISVENPGGSTTGTNTTSLTGLSQVLGDIGGLLASTSSPQASGETSSNFPGVLGNILLDQNGATIFASTINSANNSETSGFYGSDTLGSQPQGVAAQLCENTPWATNFLADIIPPSFFNSLCQWGGYQVGQPPAQTQPQVTLSQQVQTTTPAATPPAAATSTVSSVPAQVQIWAEPASVPLGARTSIFWNTQGVTSCTETSPDGSFSEDSVSGAEATVPITGSTTFTISCLDSNNNPVTDDVTVELSN